MNQVKMPVAAINQFVVRYVVSRFIYTVICASLTLPDAEIADTFNSSEMLAFSRTIVWVRGALALPADATVVRHDHLLLQPGASWPAAVIEPRAPCGAKSRCQTLSTARYAHMPSICPSPTARLGFAMRGNATRPSCRNPRLQASASSRWLRDLRSSCVLSRGPPDPARPSRATPTMSARPSPRRRPSRRRP